ncbi:MAG: acyl carrier protein [Odoribacter sp.]|nr:acyl carrier protein [Odoribacter sp.]
MEINEFIQRFAEQFDETSVESFKTDTVFKNLDEWSSLIALSVIGMVDEEYGILLKGEDIRNSNTIEDLYKIVVDRK